MFHFARVSILGTILLMAMSSSALAEQIRIVTDSFPPFSLGGEKQGFIVEATVEAVRRAGFEPKVEFIPWRRAQVIAQEENDVIIIPFSRSPDREPNYNWIYKMFPSPYGFATLKEPAINSMDEAKSLAKVGVSAGTNYEEILVKGVGKAMVEPARPEQNAEKLNLGRINAWFDGYFYITYYYNKVFPGEKLIFGKPLGASDAYVASGKSFPQDKADKLRTALESVVTDGTFERIKAAYISQQPW